MGRNTALILFGILFPLLGFGQRVTVNVEKRPCHRVDVLPGQKFFMEVKTDTGVLVSDCDYFLLPFIKLPDSIKLKLVAKLLEIGDDTSLCCWRVIDRGYNGIEGCAGHPDGAVRYTMQVDALYMINRLCWPGFMELFSCEPVLYDKRRKKDINLDGAKIEVVFRAYRKWFKHWIQNGKIGYYFPFNNGRYVWYGGRKPGFEKD